MLRRPVWHVRPAPGVPAPGSRIAPQPDFRTTVFPETVVNPLVHQHCQTSAPLLSAADIHTLSLLVPAWQTDAGALVRTFDFADYAATMAFAGAIGWLAVRENHHPDLGIHFNRVIIALLHP